MGTDIHAFAERRGPAGWQPCYQNGVTTGTEPTEPVFLSFYCGQERNYELFAILAGVRRLTNDGFQPIALCKGLPDDLSPAVREAAESPDGLWGHNHTWLTLQELLDYPWSETKRTVRVHVDAEGFRQFRTEGRPEQVYFPCATGRGEQNEPVLISNDEMERLIKEGQDTQRKFTEVVFKEPVAAYCHYFVTETLPLLRSLGDPENVRVVLWFDS
jgi:hypothetical protein